MLCLSAAGGTVVNVLDDIVSRGADQSKITIVCVVACPPALKKLSEKFPGIACRHLHITAVHCIALYYMHLHVMSCHVMSCHVMSCHVYKFCGLSSLPWKH